ncbi:MAG: hypothetical protein H6875_00140 [Hyphomicrobiaceae bacterium]|nr:hypothetical protein [Hyphomicrobiaceae bacterium]
MRLASKASHLQLVSNFVIVEARLEVEHVDDLLHVAFRRLSRSNLCHLWSRSPQGARHAFYRAHRHHLHALPDAITLQQRYAMVSTVAKAEIAASIVMMNWGRVTNSAISVM